MKNVLINLIPAITFAFFFQLSVHEFGHFIFGRLTGWKLIYIQLFNIVIGIERRLLRVKAVRSISFQCIMEPKSLSNDALFYTNGGNISNIVCSVCGLLVMVVYRANAIIWLYSWCMFAVGVAFIFVNGIPNIKRICNDGICYQLIKHNDMIRLCHNVQLKIAKLLYSGLTYKNIGKNIICLSPDNCRDDITAYQALLEYYYYLEIGNLEMMKKALSKIDISDQKKFISQSMFDSVSMEILFADIVTNLNNMGFQPLDNNVYAAIIEKYLQGNGLRGEVHFIRIKAAYEAYEHLLNDNIEGSLYSIDNAIDFIKRKNFVYSGEREFCLNQLRELRFLYKRCANKRWGHQ